MAYTIPTPADLKARYPAFAAVADLTIQTYIDDASTQSVDTSWIEADYSLAIAAKAAHEMALVNIGSHGEAAGYAAAGLTSVRSGNFQASFAESAVGRANRGGLDATPYGRVYKRLLRRSKGGPRVVGRAAYAGPPPSDGFLP